MNIQQLKSKINSLQVPKASFENDESGEPVNSFFRPLSYEGNQILLKFSGHINSPPKFYDTQFGKHYSFAVKVDAPVVAAFNALNVKLHDGSPEDEPWMSKPVATEKNVIIIKLPTKDCEFKPHITGTVMSPDTVLRGIEGANTSVGTKVSLSVKLGCWFMKNRDNKYGKGIK